VQEDPIKATLHLITFLAFLLLAPYSFSNSQVNSTPIKLATAESFLPYASYNGNKMRQWKGIDYDIALAIFQAIDVQLKPTALPRTRITRMLKNKQIDGLLSTSAYNEKLSLSKLWLSTPIYTSEVSVFSLKSRSLEIDDLSFLEAGKHHLGILKEYSYQEKDLVISEQTRVLEVSRDKQLVELLLAKRIDLAISEDISFIFQARSLGYFDAIEPVFEISSRPVSIALTQSIIEQYPDLPNKINAAIVHLLENGFIDSVIIKHLSLDQFSHSK
jgi:polar amino acid transport system substrate-binding protein